jgi:hypothetical protein
VMRVTHFDGHLLLHQELVWRNDSVQELVDSEG